MRRVALFFALIVFALVSCNKLDENKAFEANYRGTFTRVDGSRLNDPLIANVTLSFTESGFTGTSDRQHYPSICSGSFSMNQTKIFVTNTCFVTADFDWSLIFKGEFNYEQNGNQLRIWRTYANGSQDLYELTKVEQ